MALDTVRADHLQLYGYDRATSPGLAALGEAAFVFDDAQSAAPWTAPALITLMTSLYPDTHGVHGYPNPGRLSDAVVTLAEVLQDRGYATVAFTEGGYAKGSFGLAQGFDHYPANPGDDGDYISNMQFPSRLEANVDRTLQWLSEHRDEPFFLFFHTYEAHAPYRAPAEFIARFRPGYDEALERVHVRAALERWNDARGAGTAQRAELLRDYLWLRLQQKHWQFAGIPPIEDWETLVETVRAVEGSASPELSSEEYVGWLRDLYDAELAYTDAELSRVWAALERLDLADRTIVAVVSDHGEGLGDHGLLYHGTVLFEELLRAVLLIRVPGSDTPPRHIPEVVRTVDVMPTLLELLDAGTPDLQLQGESLVGLMRGAAFERPAFANARQNDGGRDPLHAVRDARWRLHWNAQTDEARLFDLSRDPAESHDVAAANPREVGRLRELLARQLERNHALRDRKALAPDSVELDADTRRQLRGLGYLED